jgi:hypothetical protein
VVAVAVITPALKLPLPSLATTLPAVLADVASTATSFALTVMYEPAPTANKPLDVTEPVSPAPPPTLVTVPVVVE